MSRIAPVDRNTANESLRKVFDGVERQLGILPNMVRTMAQSQPVLDGYLWLSAALKRGVLPGTLQEQIALVVAEANECDYCLSAHTALGPGAGLTDHELTASRFGLANDSKAGAALRFAQAVVQQRGSVSDQELADARQAGFSDTEIAEIIGNVALNVLTNYFNRAAETDIDFPRVTAGQLT
jgi:uncharacterized peroxidase-related enzyme